EQVELDIDDQIENLKSDLLNAEDNTINVFELHSVYLERKLKSINIFIRSYIDKINNKTELLEKLSDIYYMLEEITVFIDTHENFYRIQLLADSSSNSDNEIKKNLDSSKIIINHLRHDQTFKIYNGEADRFKRYAFNYEVTFYLLIVAMFVYFSGLTIYIPDFNIGNFNFGFPSKKVSSGNIVFYIQKVSVLVLSSTLAAFLLKRSFMNRELYQEAYRVAQELETLPSYIEPFSNEIKEKIRLDLAYKYFGREYNTGSNGNDKSSENSMAENIKANTEFLKALKDISISKTDKGKSETDL
ncbi:hypothetical protein ACODTQ_00865, partial [Acinetobacter pittii]|uniref:hypothetical protein n=1 Tax=Acinetobacter pittii TaxID=48296 RepID=UPI003B4FFCDB